MEPDSVMKRKRLFVDNGRPHGTVVLNWHGTPEREFIHFAEAFLLVAQDAVAALRADPQFGLEGWPMDDFPCVSSGLPLSTRT